MAAALCRADGERDSPGIRVCDLSSVKQFHTKRRLHSQGLERIRISVLIAVLLLAAGLSLAVSHEGHAAPAHLLLVLMAVMAASVRGVVLQRVLHGRDVPGLLARREIAQPLQVISAMGPWESLTSLVVYALGQLRPAYWRGTPLSQKTTGDAMLPTCALQIPCQCLFC